MIFKPLKSPQKVTMGSVGSFCLIFLGFSFFLSQDFESIYTGIFIFLDYFPLAALTKTKTLVLVFTFLITSVDSAIFVLSMFSDGGNPEPSKRFRWIWGMMIGLFTIGLMLIGKEALLESVSQLLIVFALPFSLMFLGMVLYFIRLLFWRKTTI